MRLCAFAAVAENRAAGSSEAKVVSVILGMEGPFGGRKWEKVDAGADDGGGGPPRAEQPERRDEVGLGIWEPSPQKGEVVVVSAQPDPRRKMAELSKVEPPRGSFFEQGGVDSPIVPSEDQRAVRL